jgi:hypothetical protein
MREFRKAKKTYFEVEGNEREYQRLEILHKVVEHAKTFWVLGFSHIYK